MFNVALIKPKPKGGIHTRNHRQERRIIVRYAFNGVRPNGFTAAVGAGLAAWERANPSLLFKQVPRRAPLMIKFRPLHSNNCGKATMGTFPRGAIWLDTNMTSYSVIRRTVAHEFDHIVGYGHHNSGLMWHGFETMGRDDRMYYRIPDMRKARRFRLPTDI